jgi:uncharacterized linocin/CFP29 family protein
MSSLLTRSTGSDFILPPSQIKIFSISRCASIQEYQFSISIVESIDNFLSSTIQIISRFELELFDDTYDFIVHDKSFFSLKKSDLKFKDDQSFSWLIRILDGQES